MTGRFKEAPHFKQILCGEFSLIISLCDIKFAFHTSYVCVRFIDSARSRVCESETTHVALATGIPHCHTPRHTHVLRPEPESRAHRAAATATAAAVVPKNN